MKPMLPLENLNLGGGGPEKVISVHFEKPGKEFSAMKKAPFLTHIIRFISNHM